MHHLTRRTLATTACAGALLFGAAACGDDDDTGVNVDVDEEQVEQNLDDAGDSISDTADELEDTVDENVDVGGNAEDQGD